MINAQMFGQIQNGRYLVKILQAKDWESGTHSGIQMRVLLGHPIGNIKHTENVLILNDSQVGGEMYSLYSAFMTFTGKIDLYVEDLINLVGEVTFECSQSNNGNTYPHLNNWRFDYYDN